MATLSVPAIGYPAGSPLGSVGVNINDGHGNCAQVDIKPGTSITATLFDSGNPIYAALVTAGKLVIA